MSTMSLGEISMNIGKLMNGWMGTSRGNRDAPGKGEGGGEGGRRGGVKRKTFNPQHRKRNPLRGKLNAEQRTTYLNALYGFTNVVDAEDGGTMLEGEGVDDGGTVEGFVGRGVEELPYHALA